MPAVKHQAVLADLLAEIASHRDSDRFVRVGGMSLRGRVIAAEIGVASGLTSAYLLGAVPRLALAMVDDWTCPASGTRKTQATYDYARRTAGERTSFAASRLAIVSLRSVDAAALTPIANVDLVFIDADHRYEAVRADIAAWWPKVRQGGILCGHDYDSPRNATGDWGVDRAVKEFCEATGLAAIVKESVWIVRKPEERNDV